VANTATIIYPYAEAIRKHYASFLAAALVLHQCKRSDFVGPGNLLKENHPA
jgi:hypothetical protein